MSRSSHSQEFVLKGAMLFVLWGGDSRRPTKDIDLLGRGDNSVAGLEAIFRELCEQQVDDDGVVFRAETVTGKRIREDREYEGVRIHLTAHQGTAKVVIQIDVGFGDAVTPKPLNVSFPTMLEFARPELLAYPKESVVAEKFQAMVNLGMTNTRMKDFRDLFVIARQFTFDGTLLSDAIKATFTRRRTAIPAEPPLALTEQFYGDNQKAADWQAYLKKNKLDIGLSLREVIGLMGEFLMRPSSALAQGRVFDLKWPPAGPWRRHVDGK